LESGARRVARHRNRSAASPTVWAEDARGRGIGEDIGDSRRSAVGPEPGLARRVRASLFKLGVVQGRCFDLSKKRRITINPNQGQNSERAMTVAKVIEISAESGESFEDAIRNGIEHAGDSIRNVEGAWIKEHKVVVKDGRISAFRVGMKVTSVRD
jgi:dodecin